MKKEWNTIEALRHSRHDWLNILQLIKGNLSLQRLDRVHDIIEEAIAQAKHAAHISSLQMPQFATMLLTFHWENHLNFTIEYEVLGEVTDLSMYDEAVSAWFEKFFEILQDIVYDFDNHLFLTVDISEHDIQLFLDVRGKIEKEKALTNFLDEYSDGHPIRVTSFSIQHEEASITLTVKRT